MKKILIYLVGVTFVLMMLPGCKKFLEEKPDQKLVVPSSLEDFAALLNSANVFNNVDLVSLEINSDDYFLTDADLASLTSEPDRRMYSLQKDFLFSPSTNDWLAVYRAIYYANIVLEGLEGSELKRNAAFNELKGRALVFRAKCFLQAVSLWGKAYKLADDQDLGIPLRLNSDFNQPSERAGLKACYDKIIEDLNAAVPLLRDKSFHPFQPGKAAAYGLLSRVYLYMGRYADSELNAALCLKIFPDLLDYNSVNIADRYPFPLYNVEQVFNTFTPPATIVGSSRAKIVPELIGSYGVNDLRKGLYYLITAGAYYFKGTYHQPALFFGIATDEMYLNLAECQVRAGMTTLGMETLNKLLIKRYKTGTFQPMIATNAADGLDKVLFERRKELVMRGLRWMDIKRLNAEGQGIILTRNINGVSYSLSPNDKAYVMPIPEDIIALTGMPQNER